jgi:transcriptional regulator with XRE-family HTH domain
MTLRELAMESGLSASLLSQLERGIANPSVATLRRLTETLGVSIFSLLEEPRETHTVVRPDRRRRIVIQDGRLRYELLSPDTNGQMEVWMGYLAVGEEMGSEVSSHPSEEFIFVIKGRMEIHIGGEIYFLDEACSIQYDGRQPHRIVCAGDEDLMFLSALTPPTL